MSIWNNAAMSANVRALNAQMMVWFNEGKSIADVDIRSKYENEKRASVLDCVAPGKGETADMEYVVATLGATPGNIEDGSMAVYTPGAASVSSKAKPTGFILSIHHSDLRDDRFGIIKASVQQMASDAVDWKYVTIAESIPLGLTKLTIGGKTFFATDHNVNFKNTAAGTFSNKKTLALSDDNFASVRKDFRGIKFDNGRPNHANAPDTLIVSLENESLAEKIVANPTLFGGAANPNLNKARIIVVPEWDTLDGGTYASAWVLARTMSTLKKPFVWNEREELNIQYMGSVPGGGNAGPLPGLYHQWLVYGEMVLAFLEPRYAIWSKP